MHTRKSVLVPVFTILAGVFLELNSLGIFGTALPGNLLTRLWPLLVIAAGVDLLFIQQRLIGSVIMLFFGAALLSTQYMNGGWNNPLWQFFLKVWPILLILFGIDSIFSGRSLINTAVVIAAVVVLIYCALTFLDIPALKKLPTIDITSILPTAIFDGSGPAQPGTIGRTTGSEPVPGFPAPQAETSPITVGLGGQISVSMPSQNNAILNLNAASGKVSLKAASGAGLVSGTISLSSAEKLETNANLNGSSAEYTLRSSGSDKSGTSSWDLGLSPQRALNLNAVINTGYIKADLRSLNLSAVNIENKFGPIDVMMPQSSQARIRINAGSGDIRVYIPKNGSINCTISGTSQVDYPQMSYSFGNNILAPRRVIGTPVTVEITSNGGTVRVIESE